ncbi:MAG TPA: PadR family transcriptional regulator [Gemmatimonadota bacterium]|nr:PadR family transcriptional regulator [Gemmatimonadota bacterium]
MERELKRGTIEMLLLRLLEEREMYGYELVSELQSRSGGRLEWSDGTLYPVLYRLEEAGHVEPRWVTPDRGVPRKYYRATAAGRTELERLVTEWKAFTAGVDAVLGRKDGGR